MVQQLGIPFSPAHTADELKALIKAHLLPEGKSSTQQALKGLSSMNKTELQAKAMEVGAHTTPHMSTGDLKLSIRKATLAANVPQGQDFLGFGKYGAKTYQYVKDNCPEYTDWVLREKGPESAPELVRFASWLNMEKVEQPVKEGKGRGHAKRQAVTDPNDEKDLPANASASSQAEPGTKEVLQQVVGALGQINQRLNALEQEKASTTPSTDSPMVQEPDGATSVSRQ